MSWDETYRSPVQTFVGASSLSLWTGAGFEPAAGDVLAAVAWVPGGVTVSAPAGWTLNAQSPGVLWPVMGRGRLPGRADGALFLRQLTDDVVPLRAAFPLSGLGGAMVQGQLVSYRLGRFTCPVCGRTSGSRNDAREGYCGKCHAWTAPDSGRVDLVCRKLLTGDAVREGAVR